MNDPKERRKKKKEEEEEKGGRQGKIRKAILLKIASGRITT
jgi:hypothetical protein